MNELLTLLYVKLLRTNHCLYLTNVDFFIYNQKRKLEINDENIDFNTCKAKIFKIRWTDEEDKKLLRTVQHNPTQKEWEEISKLFKRSRLGCYVRWKRLQQKVLYAFLLTINTACFSVMIINKNIYIYIFYRRLMKYLQRE